MSQNLQNFVKFQKFQLDNLVDFEKCCKTHIFLQKSEPIQPKTSNILPKFCQPTLSKFCISSTSRAISESRIFIQQRLSSQPGKPLQPVRVGEARAAEEVHRQGLEAAHPGHILQTVDVQKLGATVEDLRSELKT